jgi:hypothetical protein
MTIQCIVDAERAMINSHILLLFIVHCSKDNITSPQENVQMGEVVFDEADADVYQGSLAKGSLNLINEIRLKYFAKALAKNLTNPGACKLLKHEIGKKFDGDYDVLWEMVKDSDIPGRDKFRKVVGNRFGEGSFLSIDEIENVPLLQISLPVNFEKWDGEEPILVAYTPLTIDDIEVEEIYAYDSEGNEHVLDAKTPPDFPVIIVGLNERVEDGNYAYRNDNVSFSKTTLAHFDFQLPHPGIAHNLMKVQDLQVEHDCEPWYKGKAEVIARSYLYDGWTTTVDMGKRKEKTYYGINILIAWEGSIPYPNPYIKILEDDAGNNDDLMLDIATASVTDEGWLNGPNAKITLLVGQNIFMDFISYWMAVGN